MTALQFFGDNPLALLAATFVFALMVGSFLNVVIYRLPLMLQNDWEAQARELLTDAATEHTPQAVQENFNLAQPGSHCPQCNAPIKPWQNIPLLSYLLLGGKCGQCKTKIPLRYPAVELVTALLSCAVVAYFGASWQSAGLLLFSWVLIALTMIDFDHQLLPDNLTLPLLWLGLIANSFGLFCSLEQALWGAVAGYLSLWSLYWIFKLVTGKEGMGYGDFKLLAALGAWLGWQSLPLIILLSSLVGACVGILLIILKNRGKSVPIPFGPYLAAAGWIAALWGHQITQAYLRFSGLN